MPLQFKVSKRINAPVPLVFKTVAKIKEFQKVLPHITKVEFMSDREYGVGTKFKETRVMKGRTHETELKVVEYIENELVRITNDTGGEVWDTVIRVNEPDDNRKETELNVEMEGRFQGWLMPILLWIFQGTVKQALENDFDLVKEHCERTKLIE
mmetsp:Transcript_6748/g.8515  ORF Transcript_6748/g.8515 Transcript_6748/m.8515 type:complete len:154 (+) Transcript_6748:259-720(+)